MALHVTIIIWQIYMVVMVELNLEQRCGKKTQTKTGQYLTKFLVWVLSHWESNFCIFRLFPVRFILYFLLYPLTYQKDMAKWNSSSKHSWSIYCKMPLTENWNITVSESTEKVSTEYLERRQKSRTCICTARQHDHNCRSWQQGHCHVSCHYFYRSSQIPRAPSILWCFYTGFQSSKWADKLI